MISYAVGVAYVGLEEESYFVFENGSMVEVCVVVDPDATISILDGVPDYVRATLRIKLT